MMKKIPVIMLVLLVYTVFFTGCGDPSVNSHSLKVYSFSGENEFVSVSNGVIILDAKDEICYGGDLKVSPDEVSDIVSYITTIYINGNEKEVLLSGGVEDLSGGTIDVAGDLGKISGGILKDGAADQIADNLWFELKTINSRGEENIYQIQLDTTEITKNAENE